MTTPRIALVTGASRGFGFALAEALAGPDTHILALARTTGGLEELADKIEAKGGASTLIPLDITDEAGLRSMCRAIHDRWGHLDLLIHAAAHATPMSPADMTATKDWDKAMAVNATATQRLIALTRPLLLAAKAGQAVFVTDARAGEKFFGAYGAAKAAQSALIDSYRAETLQTGPKVSTFQPAPMPTALRARFFPGEDRAALASIEAEAARLIKTLTL